MLQLTHYTPHELATQARRQAEFRAAHLRALAKAAPGSTAAIILARDVVLVEDFITRRANELIRRATDAEARESRNLHELARPPFFG